jgi:hypothetical protein
MPHRGKTNNRSYVPFVSAANRDAQTIAVETPAPPAATLTRFSPLSGRRNQKMTMKENRMAEKFAAVVFAGFSLSTICCPCCYEDFFAAVLR